MYSPARGLQFAAMGDRSPGEMTKPIDVVAGLIVYKGKASSLQRQVLVAQRRASDSGAGFWEFPGGKVEDGESLQEALKREIQEELEMEVEVHHKLAEEILQTPTGKWIRLNLLAAESKSEKFKLHDHDAALWIDPGKLQQVRFLDGNKKFFPVIEQYFLGSK